MHNLSFKERNKELNEAEIKCEEFFKQNQIPFTRYGFDCLNTIGKEFNSIPRVLQGTPDYMAFVKNKGITRSILIESKMGGKFLRLKLHPERALVPIVLATEMILPLSFR